MHQYELKIVRGWLRSKLCHQSVLYQVSLLYTQPMAAIYKTKPKKKKSFSIAFWKNENLTPITHNLNLSKTFPRIMQPYKPAKPPQKPWETSCQYCKLSSTSKFSIDRIPNQQFRRRRSRFDNTFKGNGLPVESKWFQESVTCIFDWTYLRQ